MVKTATKHKFALLEPVSLPKFMIDLFDFAGV